MVFVWPVFLVSSKSQFINAPEAGKRISVSWDIVSWGSIIIFKFNCLHVYMCNIDMFGAHRGQKKASDP